MGVEVTGGGSGKWVGEERIRVIRVGVSGCFLMSLWRMEAIDERWNRR